MELTTTLASIVKDVADTPEKLGGDLAQSGIQPTGPMMFLYYGVTNDPHKEFTLRVALPVSKDDLNQYAGTAAKDRLQPFQFVESVLYGDIEQLGPKAYEPLMSEMAQTDTQYSGFVREVYQNFVDPTSADNETRVQIGVVVS